MARVIPEVSINKLCLCTLVGTRIYGVNLVLEVESLSHPGDIIVVAMVDFKFERFKYTNKRELELPDSYPSLVEPDFNSDGYMMYLSGHGNPIDFVIYESELFEVIVKDGMLRLIRSDLSYNQKITDAINAAIEAEFSDWANNK